jgi:uncharacterized protein
MQKRLQKSSSDMFRICFGFLLLLLYGPFSAEALEVPELRGYVNDYAGMISQETERLIEAELSSFEQTDSTQIVILTIPSLEGESLETFSISLADKWKIGQKGKDNGIILLVARDDREVRIEVGRGLEGTITDLLAGRIVDLVITPSFKRGEFDEGFIAGVSSIMDAARGEFTAMERERPGQTGKTSRLLNFLIFGGMAMLVLGSISRFFGGAAGAVGLPLAVHHAITPIGLGTGLLLGLFGFVLGFLLPFLFSVSGTRRGGRSYYRGGGFGSFGGGGGFGSGGFSGRGGGFGGGGASGRW